MFGNLNVGTQMPNEVFSGSGTSAADLQNLQKALQALDITGRETANSASASGAPLKLESLDKTLKVITYQDQVIKLWKEIPKKAAYNTVEEYNQLTSYGADRGGFYKEGELPNTEDSQYVRRAQFVRFMGVVKEVTHPMTLVNTVVGDVIQRQVKDGTLWILRKMSKALTRANSLIIPDEFNGLYAQHEQNDAFTSLNSYYNSEVVVDLRGAALSEGAIEKASEGIIQNFGLGNMLFAPPVVLSKFVQNFYGNKFIPINTEAIRAGEVGQNVQVFQSQYGPIKLNWDVFMNPDSPILNSASAQSSMAPAAPTAVSITAVAATVADSKWASSDAGTYFYAVTAVNRYGESAPTILSGSATTIVLNGSVDLVFTASASVNPATGYRIYRSNKNAVNSTTGATYYPLFYVSTSNLANGYDGGAAGTIRDNNRILPATANAFLAQMDNETLEFAQLAPLMKMDLAVVAPAYRFMILLYGTPILYAPKRLIRFINVGVV